jgi:hypothetical protein
MSERDVAPVSEWMSKPKLTISYGENEYTRGISGHWRDARGYATPEHIEAALNVIAIDSLSAASAALEQDRERLDWMQANRVYVDAHMGPRAVVISVGWDGPYDIRASIDAARAGSA